MTNEQSMQQFEKGVFDLLQDLEPAQFRDVLRKSYDGVAQKVRQIPLAKLRSSSVKVQGNKADWEAGLRSHVYSKGGGFLFTVRGRAGSRGSGAGELSMHQNRFYGKTGRKLPVLQWLEYGAGIRNGVRKTRGNGKGLRRPHETGSIRPYHFLTDSEPQMVQMVEQQLAAELGKVLANVSKDNSN